MNQSYLDRLQRDHIWQNLAKLAKLIESLAIFEGLLFAFLAKF